jgi:hypothetical protein
MRSGGSWIASYGYALNLPKESVGSDYKYGAHQASFLISKSLARRLTGTISLSGEYRDYFNFDSYHAFTTGSNVNRRYVNASVNVRLEYKAHTKLSIFTNISAFEARSNLTTRVIYQNGTIVGFQSSGMGDTRSVSTNLGMRFIF